MRVHFLGAAATVALVLLPLPARAEATPSVSASRPKPAYLVIDQLIAQPNEALRLALDLLTPEQRLVASRLLQAPERPKNHADMKEGNNSRG